MADVIKDIQLADEIEIPPIPAPQALDDFTATAVSTSAIDLAWNDNGDLATTYQIQRDFNSGFSNNFSPVSISATPGSGGVYTATSLAGSTTFYFRIRAVNSTGSSAWVTSSATTL